MTDIRFNISGKFTNKELTRFKIIKVVSIALKGGTFPYYGEIIALDSTTTKIIFKDESAEMLPILVFCFFIIFIPTLWVLWYLDVDFQRIFRLNGLLFLAIILLAIVFSIPVIRLSRYLKSTLFEDFEKIIRS